MKGNKFNLKLDKLENISAVYFLAAIIWGLVMVFLVPPFRSPDETGHYLKAAALSEGSPFCIEGQLLVSKKKVNLVKFSGVEAENTIPKTLPNVLNLINYKDIRDSGKEFYPTRTCQRFPTASIIPALGIKIGNLLGLNELYSYYLARIFNLSFSITIITLAIYLIPSGKYTIASLALLPTFVFLSATVHYDAVSIPLQFLFISYIFFLRKKREIISTIQIVFLLTIFLIFSSVKPGYEPLLFLLLVLNDPNIFKRKYSLYILIAIFVILGISVTIVPLLTLSTGFYSSTTHRNEQLFFILTHPIHFFYAIFNSFRTLGIRQYLYGLIGYLDWFDDIKNWPRHNLNSLHYILIITNLLIFIPLQGKLLKLNKREKLILIFVIVSTLLLIFTALYVSVTPIGQLLIFGVQGRYFMGISPLIMFIYYSLVSQKRQLLRKKLFNKAFLLYVALNAVATLWTIYSLYYGDVFALYIH